MTITIRDAEPADAARFGQIIFDGFAALADHHRFPRDFPSAEVASDIAAMLLSHPAFAGVAAEADGAVIGCNFVNVSPFIAGIGPITVDPAVQNRGVGRALMQAVMEKAQARALPAVRLVQAAYHNRSLCLYTSLGFQTREPLSVLTGTPLGLRFPGYEVRVAESADLPACDALCRAVHGFDRAGELAEAVASGSAHVVEHLGRIAGYTTGIGFFAHSVAENHQALKALIGAAIEITGPGFLLPTRNYDVLSWCLAHGLRLVMQMTLMTIGPYQEPEGAWLPSILY